MQSPPTLPDKKDSNILHSEDDEQAGLTSAIVPEEGKPHNWVSFDTPRPNNPKMKEHIGASAIKLKSTSVPINKIITSVIEV